MNLWHFFIQFTLTHFYGFMFLNFDSLQNQLKLNLHKLNDKELLIEIQLYCDCVYTNLKCIAQFCRPIFH